MALAVERAVMPDNALRNILRRVPPNSVLYYPGLDYGNWYTGTILDYSGLSAPNNGTITGATPVRLSSGLPVLSLDGDDYVEIADAPNLRNFTSFSLKMWVKTVSTSAYIIHKGSLLSNKYYTVYTDANGKLIFAYRDDNVLEKSLTSTNAWNDNKYHQLLLSARLVLVRRFLWMESQMGVALRESAQVHSQGPTEC